MATLPQTVSSSSLLGNTSDGLPAPGDNTFPLDAAQTTGKAGTKIIYVDQLKSQAKGMIDTAQPATGTYGCTPKYISNHADSRRMARFFIPQELYKAVISAFPEAAKDTAIFKRLSTTDRVNGGYYDFLLQSVNENFAENIQVTETLSDNYVAFVMGQKPSIFSYSGILINSVEDDWRTKFFLLYSQYLRASKMARFGRTSKYALENVSLLKYDNIYVRGVMLNLSLNMNAQNELAVPFSFQYLVKEIHPFKQSSTAGADITIVDAGSNYRTAGVEIAQINTNGRSPNDPYTGLTVSKTALAAQKAQDTANIASQNVTSPETSPAGGPFKTSPGPVIADNNQNFFKQDQFDVGGL